MTGEYQPLTSLGDLAETVKAKANVLLLQPADVLVLSNADGITAAPGSAELIERIRDDLGVSQVYVFAQDIDLSVLRSSTTSATSDLDKHLQVTGDEDGGVTIGCTTCGDGDHHAHIVAHAGWSPPEGAPTARSLGDLVTAATEHVRTVHPEAT